MDRVVILQGTLICNNQMMIQLKTWIQKVYQKLIQGIKVQTVCHTVFYGYSDNVLSCMAPWDAVSNWPQSISDRPESIDNNRKDFHNLELIIVRVTSMTACFYTLYIVRVQCKYMYIWTRLAYSSRYRKCR